MYYYRYVVGSNRILFLLSDGAQAWEIKDFLVEQDRCEVVTIEGRDYYGKAYTGVSNRTHKFIQDQRQKNTQKLKVLDITWLISLDKM